MKIEGLIFLITLICPLISFILFYWMHFIYSVSKLIWDIKAKSKADETDETDQKVNQ